DLLERLAGRALVLDLLAQRRDLLAGPLVGEAVPDLALDLIEGALLAGDDLGHAQEHDGELTLDGLRQLVLLESEGRIGNLAVDQVLAGEDAEVVIAFLEA